MRYHLVAAALAVGLASPALAQSYTLPTGSERAAQPPIDWTGDYAPAWGVPRLHEGRAVAIDPQALAPHRYRWHDSD